MLFSGVPFLYYFLPITVLLYAAAPKRMKNAVLLTASLAFYAWGEGRLVFLFAAAILIGWLAGLAIERTRGTGWARAVLLFSVLIDLGLLGYFKYADFFLENVNSALGLSLPLPHIALPIGISFYTFQLLSYTVDVYRGTVSAQKNLSDFGTYVALFPQLIAGPIVRYSDVAFQLRNRSGSVAGIARGIRRFLLGLGKKVLIANVLGEIAGWYWQTEATVLMTWLYAVSYMLQVYFDFSGYSDMAIGLGKIFGFDFPENFDYPYISRSVTEFWRRWHMTLGSWFRDYVYIPMGGNRRGLPRQIFNIFVVWMLTGLWHGAAWNFVFWGLWFALLLTAEKLGLKKWLDRYPAWGRLYTLSAAMFGFLIFNSAGLSEAARDAAGLFSFGVLPLSDVRSRYVLRSYGVTLLIGVIGATPIPKKTAEWLREKEKCGAALTMLEPVFLTALLLTATSYLVDGSFNPFLYFRF